jgi:hypothetical protein
MDLAIYTRVLWRFRYLVFAGALLGIVLALLSFYKIDFGGGKPTFTHRQSEIWQSESVLFLTQPGFAAGRTVLPYVVKDVAGEKTAVPSIQQPSEFTDLSPLYARLANSDAVKRLVLRDGKLPGKYSAIPAADTTYSDTIPLPMLEIFGTATSSDGAKTVARRATTGFLTYLRKLQIDAGIPDRQRVDIEILNAPSNATVIQPRKKTLPIVVFMAVLFAVMALAFVLENARPGIRVVGSERVEGETLKDVRRSA